MALRTILKTEVRDGLSVRTRYDSTAREYRTETVRNGKVREAEINYTTDRTDAIDTHGEIVKRLVTRRR